MPSPRAAARAILAVLGLLAWMAPSQAATFYVSGLGNDATGTGSQRNPFRNIRKAHQAASHGDTILVTKGNYGLGIPLTKRVRVQAIGGNVQIALNEAPIVEVAPPLPTVGRTGQWVTFQAVARDDGLPPGSQLTYLWRVIAGPGPAEVAWRNASTVRFKFFIPGSYTVQVVVSDGEQSSLSYGSVTVQGGIVDPPPPPLGVATAPSSVADAPQLQTANVHSDAFLESSIGAGLIRSDAPLGPEWAGTGDLRVLRVPGGGKGLGLHAVPGETYRIERSTDLVNWVGIQVVAATEEFVAITDLEPPPTLAVFYRAVRLDPLE